MESHPYPPLGLNSCVVASHYRRLFSVPGRCHGKKKTSNHHHARSSNILVPSLATSRTSRNPQPTALTIHNQNTFPQKAQQLPIPPTPLRLANTYSRKCSILSGHFTVCACSSCVILLYYLADGLLILKSVSCFPLKRTPIRSGWSNNKHSITIPARSFWPDWTLTHNPNLTTTA